jgi:hypothetical protein
VHELPPTVLYASPQTEGADWSLFRPAPQSVLDAAGNLYISRGDPYRIDVHDPAGTHVRGISRDFEPTPITDGDMERLKRMVSQFYDTMAVTGSRDPRAERDRVLQRVERQRGYDPRPHLPPLGRLLVSGDGSFWLERIDGVDPAQLEMERLFGGFSGGARASRWDLFDRDGRFLGSVALDGDFRAHAVRGYEVTGVMRDELDVEYVVTYRVAPPD